MIQATRLFEGVSFHTIALICWVIFAVAVSFASPLTRRTVGHAVVYFLPRFTSGAVVALVELQTFCCRSCHLVWWHPLLSSLSPYMDNVLRRLRRCFVPFCICFFGGSPMLSNQRIRVLLWDCNMGIVELALLQFLQFLSRLALLEPRRFQGALRKCNLLFQFSGRFIWFLQ